jgi:hypothetical protein
VTRVMSKKFFGKVVVGAALGGASLLVFAPGMAMADNAPYGADGKHEDGRIFTKPHVVKAGEEAKIVEICTSVQEYPWVWSKPTGKIKLKPVHGDKEEGDKKDYKSEEDYDAYEEDKETYKHDKEYQEYKEYKDYLEYKRYKEKDKDDEYKAPEETGPAEPAEPAEPAPDGSWKPADPSASASPEPDGSAAPAQRPDQYQAPEGQAAPDASQAPEGHAAPDASQAPEVVPPRTRARRTRATRRPGRTRTTRPRTRARRTRTTRRPGKTRTTRPRTTARRTRTTRRPGKTRTTRPRTTASGTRRTPRNPRRWPVSSPTGPASRSLGTPSPATTSSRGRAARVS